MWKLSETDKNPNLNVSEEVYFLTLKSLSLSSLENINKEPCMFQNLSKIAQYLITA